MKYRYKIEFEIVTPFGEGRQFYTGEQPNTTSDKVPERFWHVAGREANTLDEMLTQYRNLRKWAETGEQLVRNVKLYEATLPRWQEVDERKLS